MIELTAEEISSGDALKRLEEIGTGDVRNSFFSRVDAMGIRKYSLAEHHADIERIQLSPHVSTDVVVQFETARSLYLYAWYVYRFYPVAQHQALTCLELGLREKLGSTIPASYLGRSKIPTMRPLLQYAIDSGLLRNEGFRQWRKHVLLRAKNRYRDEKIATVIDTEQMNCDFHYENAVPNEQDRDFDYLTGMKKFLSHLRNSHAHGSTNLSNQVLGTFELVQEILDQLYEPT